MSLREITTPAADRGFPHGVLHRYCEHHWYGNLHESRFPGAGNSIRIRTAHALDHWRMRRALLWRIERRTAAFRRGISFSVADLSSRARVHGGIYFRHRRIRRARGARRHGVWEIFYRRLWHRLAP